MKSEEEKLRQRQLMKEFQRKEIETFISGLPMEIKGFLNLFDVLNEKLGIEECDHTLRFTEQFLSIHQLPLQEVVLWLNEYGGYCDCEVLFNIEEKFENL